MAPKESHTKQFIRETNLPITDQDTLVTLRAKLRAMFGIGPGEASNFSNAFIESLLKNRQLSPQIPTTVQIKPVTVQYKRGPQLRFFIPFRRGLFGLSAVNKVIHIASVTPQAQLERAIREAIL